MELHKCISHISKGATGATAVANKFWDTLTLLQPGGQILPTIAEVAPNFFPWFVSKCWKKKYSSTVFFFQHFLHFQRGALKTLDIQYLVNLLNA